MACPAKRLSEWSKVQVTPGVTEGYVILPNGTLTNTEFPGFGGWLGMLSIRYLPYLFKKKNCLMIGRQT